MEQLISRMTEKMIHFYNGSPSLVAHFLKVHAYARLIALRENVARETLYLVEMAAILHDIAIPYCMEAYGDAAGPLQEKESEGLLRPFLDEFALPAETVERLIFLVSHHHTYQNVSGLDWQILLEADFLVNADESHHSRLSIDRMAQNVFKTKTGLALLRSIFRQVQ